MAVNIVSKCWTYEIINDTLIITSDYCLSILSILASSGTVSIIGSKSANGILPQPINLKEGQAVVISDGDNSSLLIDGITITTTGTASLIGR